MSVSGTMQDMPKPPSQGVGACLPANAVLCVPAALLLARKWIIIGKQSSTTHRRLAGGGSRRWACALLDL
ncbi:hypothetical protein LY78DRAFT_220381 [Colletotrichum sublineola]|nr:hypothetical protein LY78DRAFT_220381 [Colletotrichum sublineola]